MKKTKLDITVNFRVLNLNKLQAYTLKRELLDSSYQKHNEHEQYIGSVSLTNFSIDDINDFYVRQMIDITECDILVSTISDNHSNTVEIPTVVNRMLKYIDCQLTYAFSIK